MIRLNITIFIVLLLSATAGMSHPGMNKENNNHRLRHTVDIRFGEKYSGNNITEYINQVKFAIKKNFYINDKWQGKRCTIAISFTRMNATVIENGDTELCNASLSAVEQAFLPKPSGDIRKDNSLKKDIMIHFTP